MLRLFLLLSSALLFGQAVAQNPFPPSASKTSSTQNWQPQLRLDYLWNSSNQAWDSTYRNSYFYTNGVLPATALLTQEWNNGFQDYRRYAVTYDADGQAAVVIQENFVNGQWENANESYYLYNNQGDQTSELDRTWTGSAWDTIYFRNSVFTYDSQDRLLMREDGLYDEVTGLFYADVTWKYTWGSGAGWTSELSLDGAPNSTDTVGYAYNVTWHDFEKELFSFMNRDFWSNGQRNFRDRITRTYSANDSYDEITESRDFGAPAFLLKDREIRTFNSLGDITSQKSYYYDTTSNTWVFQFEDSYLNTYDSNDNLVDWIFQKRSDSTAPFTNLFRQEYINYILDQSAPTFTEEQLAWSNHPVGQTGELLVEHDRSGMLLLEVMDLQGRKLKTMLTPHQGGKQMHSFDLGLPSGSYVYYIQLQDRSKWGRLQVR